MNTNYEEFFEVQISEIEKALYGTRYNKTECTDLIGRLRGSISYAYFFGHITVDELNVYEKKYKEYYSLNVDRKR